MPFKGSATSQCPPHRSQYVRRLRLAHPLPPALDRRRPATEGGRGGGPRSRAPGLRNGGLDPEREEQEERLHHPRLGPDTPCQSRVQKVPLVSLQSRVRFALSPTSCFVLACLGLLICFDG